LDQPTSDVKVTSYSHWYTVHPFLQAF